MLTIPPVVPVTQFTSTFTLNSGNIPDLAVASTVGFAQTGDLFVQTTNGVATIHYTNTTSNSFTGCSVIGDTYDVGAGDTSGTLDPTYHAVFQATHQTFDLTIPNQTNLPDDGSHDLFYSMQWSSVGSSNHSFYTLLQDSPGHFKFVNFSDYSNGQQVTGQGTNSALPDFQLADTGGTTTIELPYMPINSGRIYFFVGPAGTTSPLSSQNDSPGVWSVVQPAASTANYIYDYVEVNLDANGNATGSANPNLSMMTIDTTQVDQFGIPMTLNGNSNDGQNTTSSTSGVTDSPDVARDQIISDFASLHPSGDIYNQLIVGPSAQSGGLDLRIVNPANANITTSSALGYVFDNAIKSLFESGSNTLDLVSNADHTTYTGTRTQVSALDKNGLSHTYNVIQYTNGTNTFYIYEPFFSTNAPATASLSPVDYSTAPPPPSWIAIDPQNQTSETAGQMVFGNDGVFADYANQTGVAANLHAILGDLENQVVAALNRGVSGLNSSQWGSAPFYQTGTVYNQYAKFLHDEQINGTPIMINGDAYAFPYDDNGNNSTKLGLQNQNDATVTLGPWTTSAPSAANVAFLAAVYDDVLHRAVDPGGQTYWLGLLTGGTSREQVSLGIVTSIESHGDIIKGFYTDLLHRSADTPGLNNLLNLFAQGFTQPEIKSVFYGSEEYFQTRGGGTNAGFLDAVYNDELNRPVDSQGQAFYGQLLTDGHSRGYVASLLMESQEAIQDVVQSYYLAYLSRPADAAGLAIWTNLIEASGLYSLVQSGLLGSNEYFQRT